MPCFRSGAIRLTIQVRCPKQWRICSKLTLCQRFFRRICLPACRGSHEIHRGNFICHGGFGFFRDGKTFFHGASSLLRADKSVPATEIIFATAKKILPVMKNISCAKDFGTNTTIGQTNDAPHVTCETGDGEMPANHGFAPAQDRNGQCAVPISALEIRHDVLFQPRADTDFEPPRHEDTKFLLSASNGDLNRLGSGERNLPEAKARCGPSERARASHWN